MLIRIYPRAGGPGMSAWRYVRSLSIYTISGSSALHVLWVMQGDEQEQELTGGEPQLRRCNSSGEEPNNSGTTSDDEERSQQVFVYKELSAIRRSIKVSISHCFISHFTPLSWH